MIQGTNIILKQPLIGFESKDLLDNPEINELLTDLKKYFKQKNIIYDADLILSNNEYATHQGKFGPYKKRIDITIKLRHITEITFYSKCIKFKSTNNEYYIEIMDDFFYFIEWEKDYYL